MRKRAVRGSQLHGELEQLARDTVQHGGHYTKEYRVERGITYVHYKITTATQLARQQESQQPPTAESSPTKEV